MSLRKIISGTFDAVKKHQTKILLGVAAVTVIGGSYCIFKANQWYGEIDLFKKVESVTCELQDAYIDSSSIIRYLRCTSSDGTLIERVDLIEGGEMGSLYDADGDGKVDLEVHHFPEGVTKTLRRQDEKTFEEILDKVFNKEKEFLSNPERNEYSL